jgi:hypothetical protein
METSSNQYSGPEEWKETANWVIEKHQHTDKCAELVRELMPSFPKGMEKDFLLEFSCYPYASLDATRNELEKFVEAKGPDGWKSVLNNRFSGLRELLSGNKNIATFGINGVDEEIVYS